MKLARTLGSALCALFLAAPAIAQCPDNSIVHGCGKIWYDYLFSLPGAQLGGLAWQLGMPCKDGCYDIPHGALAATGYWTFEGCGSAPQMADEYTVTGIPDGTPVSFTAHLLVEGSITTNGVIRAWIGENSVGAPLGLDTRAAGAVSADVTFPLQRTAGVPFSLVCGLGAEGTGDPGAVQATATLRFSGLPQGASIVSCQSYSLPVAVQSSTWGSVKAVYR